MYPKLSVFTICKRFVSHSILQIFVTFRYDASKAWIYN